MSAGMGGWKKRMLVCNGPDRGFNVTPRETGQTSNWSFTTRKLTESLTRRKANESSDHNPNSRDCLCASRKSGMAPDRLGQMPRKCQETASPYREGNQGRQVGESQIPPASANPLVQRQSIGRQTSDRKPRQANTRSGQGNMVHTNSQISGRNVPQTAWIQATPFEEDLHS